MVIYDKITVSHPALGPHEPLADHIVGACLFVLALAIFFTAIERLRRHPRRPRAAAAPVRAWPVLRRRRQCWCWRRCSGRTTCIAARPGDGGFGGAAYAGEHRALPPGADWRDETYEGVVVYSWGEYVGPDKPAATPGGPKRRAIMCRWGYRRC